MLLLRVIRSSVRKTLCLVTTWMASRKFLTRHARGCKIKVRNINLEDGTDRAAQSQFTTSGTYSLTLLLDMRLFCNALRIWPFVQQFQNAWRLVMSITGSARRKDGVLIFLGIIVATSQQHKRHKHTQSVLASLSGYIAHKVRRVCYYNWVDIFRINISFSKVMLPYKNFSEVCISKLSRDTHYAQSVKHQKISASREPYSKV